MKNNREALNEALARLNRRATKNYCIDVNSGYVCLQEEGTKIGTVVKNVSPRLKIKEMILWIDAFTDGIGAIMDEEKINLLENLNNLLNIASKVGLLDELMSHCGNQDSINDFCYAIKILLYLSIKKELNQ